MKSDLYMKKSSFSYNQEKLVLLQKLSALCISKSIRWIFLYIFPWTKHTRTLSKKKKEKKRGGTKRLKCTGDLLLPMATRYIDLENIANHLDFGFRVIPSYNSVVHRFKSSFRKKEKKYSHWNTSSYLQLAAATYQLWFSCVNEQNKSLLCLS